MNQAKNTSQSFDKLLWWRISDQEVSEQVKGYHDLSVFRAARKQSALWWLVSIGATFIFLMIEYGDVNNFTQNVTIWDFSDIIIFVILALFAWTGQRWAFLISMIWWTLEKIFGLFVPPIGNPLLTLLWWNAYMRSFYLAYKVEQARRKSK